MILAKVLTAWKLPSNYVDFLTRFGPLHVLIESKRFFNGGLEFFGPGELLKRQIGLAWDRNGKRIPGWPASHVVIAEHAGDPFVLDLSQTSGDDAPVLTADHEIPPWQFTPVTSSFARFLSELS